MLTMALDKGGLAVSIASNLRFITSKGLTITGSDDSKIQSCRNLILRKASPLHRKEVRSPRVRYQ